ncbi:MAG: hypothetical protein LBK18_09385 [Prevotellaceae bacterium]|jgi:hypothetical protein|nr:hypothetical protein [Prevotellaceae bacterium]
MKRYHLVIAAFLTALAFTANSQEKKGAAIGGHVGYGWIDYDDHAGMDGAPVTRGKDYYRVGFDYEKPLSKHFSIATGLYYTLNNIVRKSNQPPQDPVIIRKEKISLLCTPVYLKLHFLRYLNIGAGLNLDNVYFVGPRVSAGAAYEFESGLILSLNADAHFSVFFARAYAVQQGYHVGLAYRLKKFLS